MASSLAFSADIFFVNVGRSDGSRPAFTIAVVDDKNTYPAKLALGNHAW
jgi:hypothetical protein